MRMPENFDAEVYAVVAEIPAGRVVSYKQIARLIGMPDHARRVGRALAEAPAGLPCHRVVNSAGRTVPGWTRQMTIAQRVGGVDVGDLERKSVEFVVIDGDLGQNLDSGGEPLAGFGFEVSCDAGVGRAPDHGARLGQRNAVVAPFFDQFEVAVA